MNAYLNQYQNNQVLNASPEQILIQLYDGAIRFVSQAKMAFAENRSVDKAQAISKTVAIVAAFSNTLDREVGGEIAEELSQLYDFMLRELSLANSTNNAEKLDPVENILRDLREAFVGAIEINRKSAQPEQSASNAQGYPGAANVPAAGNPEVRHFASSC